MMVAFIAHTQTSYTFDCTFHEKGAITKDAKATISIDEISNGIKCGKSLKVEAYTLDNPSNKVFLTYTDPTNGYVTCASVTEPFEDPDLSILEYRWVFQFINHYPDNNTDAFEISVKKAKGCSLNETGFISVQDFYNKKSRGYWITADYNSEVWLEIVKIITKFKETHSYRNWQEK